jgi:Domain of unknown function (DUF4112)
MASIDTTSLARHGAPSAPKRAASRALEHERTLRRLDRLERLLDRRFGVFGLDSVLGLVPVVGDTASGLLSAYLIYEAHKAGADHRLKAKMLGNAGFDFLLGMVPVVGDIGDVFFKANTRNVRLLKEHLGRRQPRQDGSAFGR